ncbi:hypothetical protein BO70DRAFT_395052 [Aspergillus heteromorphus CBS 117.55]|uniref:5-oxoprolinase n=1 Tax=Aspergillus heteromorphus CBS 117.55 TaxID=1448321 RepID=A0A317WHJ4_9EURO|nr:uncharacterized protein BO70DRAFT_395052 [Aspergillus heteromorphus CBS 117.55]PWY85916.1 hypothetical protein BO70DRAFT_395052 [Aspergillus heteromorphus CBS 117.55]
MRHVDEGYSLDMWWELDSVPSHLNIPLCPKSARKRSISSASDRVFKLLSEDPANYRDAPTEAIRRALEAIEGRAIPRSENLDGSRIASCRIGTTIATNALLQGKGERFAFVTTQGFKDVCARPLHDTAVEVNKRVTVEDYDLNPFPMDKTAELTDPALVRTTSGEIIRILQELDLEAVRETLLGLQAEAYTSLAIAFMHSYLFPDHETQVAALARELGFRYVTTSAEVSPVVKYLRRSNSVCSEAFLGNEALLSGPAGGVVGVAKTCFDPNEGTPVIGFDMGGTSTDVSRYDGTYDYLSETTIAGRIITTPMLNIATVAAGGGSILFARNGLFVVGPDSAGAHPGPACDRKGGPLTVTDANLFLGRLVLSSFPSIFGPNADQPLGYAATVRKFQEITQEINTQTGQNLTPEEAALGFINIANETMSRPIRNATEARGFHPERHNLVSFGGAGGQHACSIANRLGIKRILIHKYSSILSAVGISGTDLQVHPPSPSTSKNESLSLRYQGTDTNLVIPKPAGEDYGAAFRDTHTREFAFALDRPVIVDSIQVRGSGSSGSDVSSSPFTFLDHVKAKAVHAVPQSSQSVFVETSWQDIPVYHLAWIPQSIVHGPSLIIDATQTIFLSIVAHRFMAIAEPMGNMLQRTSISTSIKERLDVSCAIFSPDGKLVANAPHIPIHLGSMQFAIQHQHRPWHSILEPGDVPQPKSSLSFYVAARDHHTDIGGKGITAMIPDSTHLWEEGLSITSLTIVSRGIFLEGTIRSAFLSVERGGWGGHGGGGQGEVEV